MKKSTSQDLYGLVLVGGKSARMKQDKASLKYHGQEQSVHCFHLLERFCSKVFLSNRKDQRDSAGQKGFPQIHDAESFLDIGPLAGILSAMEKYPDVSWLVLACDLPFVDEKTIQYLIDHRNPVKIATVFKSVHDNLPEPLCAIYEAHGQKSLKDFLKQGIQCPRKILINSDTELLTPPDKKALENINYPEEYSKVCGKHDRE